MGVQTRVSSHPAGQHGNYGRRSLRLLFALALASLTALSVAAAASAATTISVAPSGTDGPSCGTGANPCKTIGYAVGKAGNGDTVSVAAGTYTLSNTIHIQKSITLQGAQHGVDARSRTVPGAGESTVTGPIGGGQALLNIEANDVVIDGFTITGASGGPGLGATSSSAGYQIVNNIISNNVFGIYANSGGAAGAVPGSLIKHNLIENNNQPGPSSGNGIYADAGTQDLTIKQNTFTGDTNGSVFAAGNITPTAPPQRNIAVTGNIFKNEAPIQLLGGTDSSFTANRFTGGSNAPYGVGLDGVHNVQVSGNSFSGLGEAALEIFDYNFNVGTKSPPDNPGPSSGVTVTSNVVAFTGAHPGSSYTGQTGGAFQVQYSAVSSEGYSPAYTGTLQLHNNVLADDAAGVVNQDPTAAIDARDNFWGCNAGPNHSGCDKTAGPGITSSPFLVLSVSAAASKIVTGGQTDSIQATISKDSAGHVVTGRFPAVPIAFSTSLGTISPTHTSTGAHGNAHAVLTSGSKAGTAIVSATLVNATATTSVKFLKPSARVSILTHKAHLSASGTIKVRLRCVTVGVSRCIGTLTLSRGGKTLGTGSYSIAAGKKAKVEIQFSKSTQQEIANHKKGLRMTASARTDQPGQSASTTTAKVRVLKH